MPDIQPKHIFILTALIGVVIFFVLIFGAPRIGTNPEQFNVVRGASHASIAESLKAQGFIRSEIAFRLIFFIFEKNQPVVPGGYVLSKSSDLWDIIQTLIAPPQMKWVVIPEGLRKEEIANLLSQALNWSSTTEAEWLFDTNINPYYVEGVYFPDTYLIPLSDVPADVIKELQSEFQTQFAPYADEATAKNIKWTTALTLASIIQREAASNDDMPLISGILWNRLLSGIKLDVDSTVQYARGDTSTGWWAPITAQDKTIDSPFNTYTHAGIPPHPISNPGIAAISAALNPATTTCIYYLHDSNRQIHCADTLDEQENNIVKYLQN